MDYNSVLSSYRALQNIDKKEFLIKNKYYQFKMKKYNIFTNFYTLLSGEDLVFEGSLPTISEPEEEKQTNEVNAD